VQYRLSPDGRWVAYSSTESGREEVYVTHFPSGQGRWQVSQNGGTFPAWSGDSTELFYLATDLVLHAAGVNAKSTEFELSSVQSLFQITYSTPVGNPFDVTPDGRLFVLSTFPESVPTPLVLVTNWVAELKK
jgi:Tol biopolymer transport system component